MISQPKLLLAAVFAPYGITTEYADGIGLQMELLNNQITREQGVHSPRQSYWSFGLYLMAENVPVDAAVLDFPTWQDFTEELKKGYTHVGISFIVPNVLKAGRMAKYIRAHHPEIKIILGGYGTIIPDLQELVPHDEICHGEGVRWLRNYFGGDPDAPIKHPVIIGPAFEYIYGYAGKPSGGVLLPGLGCENACTFCITSHKFEKRYVALLKTGREVFDACRRMEVEKKATGFSVMDENFLKQPQRARELLNEMEQHSRPYVFDIFSSAETITQVGTDFLVRLGVRMVWVGVESMAYTHKKMKGIDLKGMIEELQSKGIIVIASAILFQDHHDSKTINEEIDWVVGLESNLVQFMNYTPYPSTALYEQYKKDGRMKDVGYRHQHGQGMLNFEHPHFKNPKEHARITRDAFRRKYRTHGPGVLNMALTAVRGYQKARRDMEERQRQGLAWNPETLRYEKSEAAAQDKFMKQRVRVMRMIAIGYRPALVPALVYAPNRAARLKAREVIRLYNEVFGKARFSDKAKGLALVGTAAAEMGRYGIARLRGREGGVRQPPCRLTEYKKAPQQSC